MASFVPQLAEDQGAGVSFVAPNWSQMTPGQRHAYVVDFWKNNGVPNHVALGIADGLKKESGLDLTAANPKSGATGLAQDLGSRKTELLAQPNWSDPDVQLNNMLREVNGGDKIAARHWDEIKNAKTREQAAQLWSKYFERPELTAGGRGTSLPASWTVSPAALAREQNISTSDVRYMSPEEYLDLLPPIENNAGNAAKRISLQQSLENGDQIEAVPSLDVRQKGNNLHVEDWDGRNRAQSAIDAGVDEIPVAIRGTSKDNSGVTHIVGANKSKTKLPYNFTKVLSPVQQARQIVPEAFPQQSPGVAMEMARGQNTSLTAPPSPVPLPQKPDFYPEIVAGINKDIVNPAGYGYRGVGVPNPTDNATAGGRIANANATSAGQIGIQKPSFLSALNPISSAEAAEPISFRPVLADQGTAPISFSPVKDNPYYSPTAPILNTMMALPMALAGDAYALGAPLFHGHFPTSESISADKAFAISHLAQPETPAQQAFSSVINSMGTAISNVADAATRHVLGDRLANKIEPWAGMGFDILAALAPFSRITSAPGRAILNRTVQTPEMRAANVINKHQPKEEAAGGKTAPQVANEMARAKSLGVPLAPLDFFTEGGPQSNFFQKSMERSKPATATTKNFLETRQKGTRASSTQAPTGGILERATQTTERKLGVGSAYDVGKNLNNKVEMAEKDVGIKRQDLADINDTIQLANAQLKKSKSPAQRAALDSIVKKLLVDRDIATKAYTAAEKELARHKDNQAGLKLGVSIFDPDIRKEHVRDYLRKPRSPKDQQEAISNLKLGISDALRKEYNHAGLGKELKRIEPKGDMRDKIDMAFGNNRRAAKDFLDAVDYEEQGNKTLKNVLTSLKRNNLISDRDMGRILLLGEAVGHLTMGLLTGHYVYAPIYWGIRGARHITSLLLGGGGIATGKRSNAIANILTNPDVKLATNGSGLVEMPSRPSTGISSQGAVNSLARGIIPGLYSTIAAQQQNNEAP